VQLDTKNGYRGDIHCDVIAFSNDKRKMRPQETSFILNTWTKATAKVDVKPID